jgi:hypothetical protein
MKIIILLIISMICGCLKPNPIELYRKIGNDTYTHQCNLPIFYGVDASVPDELKPVIINAFNYWDSLFEYNLFFYVGDNLDKEVVDSGAVVIVGISKKESEPVDKMKSITHIGPIYNIEGCMPNPRIKINNGILIFNDNSIETVVRHEIGHVLGFIDTTDSDDIMHRTIDMLLYIDEPKEASEWEKKAFEIFYKR